MGGYGSGSYTYRKNLVENGEILNINAILKSNYIKDIINGDLSYYSSTLKRIKIATGQDLGLIGYKLERLDEDLILSLDYIQTNIYTKESTSIRYQVNLIPLNRIKRGKIYLFECPLCHKYKGFKLYNSGSNFFACRKCLKLNYQSSKDSRKFDSLDAVW